MPYEQVKNGVDRLPIKLSQQTNLRLPLRRLRMLSLAGN
jgi:hypothetical protein